MFCPFFNVRSSEKRVSDDLTYGYQSFAAFCLIFHQIPA
ncbi:hypothetical protein MCC93_25940 [Morococcus cerebrosus]|uniref:Uncharacterized protein n=1 Tax=Morococcus cerebrosus TaxID=1056807 RepID=A0A0C1GH15_9NEIS|nr:hypothetical protein MCC93_25940 [Morococcus cerebrosus]